MSQIGTKYTAGELWRFLDGPRLIDGSDLNHNFELLFYPQFATVIIPSGTTTYNVQPRDMNILVNTTANDVILLLPEAATFLQPLLNIKKNDTNSSHQVIVKPHNGQTIEMAATFADPYLVTLPLQTVTLCSDFSTNWPILGT